MDITGTMMETNMAMMESTGAMMDITGTMMGTNMAMMESTGTMMGTPGAVMGPSAAVMGTAQGPKAPSRPKPRPSTRNTTVKAIDT
jgi:hypothetical protein